MLGAWTSPEYTFASFGAGQLHKTPELATPSAVDDTLLQSRRRRDTPASPTALSAGLCGYSIGNIAEAFNIYRPPPSKDTEILRAKFPNVTKDGIIQLTENFGDPIGPGHQQTVLRVGIAFSGLPAPGCHNVVSGLFEFLKERWHPNCQIFGFLGGLTGIIEDNAVEIVDFVNGGSTNITTQTWGGKAAPGAQLGLSEFRNQGGCHMLRLGWLTPMDTQDFYGMMCTIKRRDLHGLVIVGGDETTASCLSVAQYLRAHKEMCKVICVVKGAEGEIFNDKISISLGFCTVSRTVSGLVGNLACDVASSGHYYHFVKVIGRTSSHLALEVALQTRVNLTIIAEEMKRDARTLLSIVQEIGQLVVARFNSLGHKNFGVIVVPDCLLDFLPDWTQLVLELKDVNSIAEAYTSLGSETSSLFGLLPASVRESCLQLKDAPPHVKACGIPVELLLAEMVSAYVSNLPDLKYSESFHPMCHSFGIEGRGAMPCVFDSNYSYSLGCVAGALIANVPSEYCAGITAGLSNITQPPTEWVPYGVPLLNMMRTNPIRLDRQLVDLDGKAFALFQRARQHWSLENCYKFPGPLQFDLPGEDVPYIVKMATDSHLAVSFERLLNPRKPFGFEDIRRRVYFARHQDMMSHVEAAMLNFPVVSNSSLLSRDHMIAPKALSRINSATDGRIPFASKELRSAILRAFPLQYRQHRSLLVEVVNQPDWLAASSKSRMTTTCSPLIYLNKAANSLLELGVVNNREGVDEFDRSLMAVYYAEQKAAESNMFPRSKESSHDAVSKQDGVLRVGVLLGGQQAPGVSNVVFGIWDHLKYKGRLCNVVGFVGGVEGFLDPTGPKTVELCKEVLSTVRNQSGLHLLGRSAESEVILATEKGRRRAAEVVRLLKLDGLIIIGGRFALTDACLLTEDFLRLDIKTQVIGVPATQNNNLGTVEPHTSGRRGALIESSIGFHSACESYGESVGNILTDAESMNSVWYFVRVMGRDRSHVVIEVALKTRPPVTILPEFYSGIGERNSLVDIVNDVAEAVIRRPTCGVALVSEGIIVSLPPFRRLIFAMQDAAKVAQEHVEMRADIVMELNKSKLLLSRQSHLGRFMDSEAEALLAYLPVKFRMSLWSVCYSSLQKRLRLSDFHSDELIVELVKLELNKRATECSDDKSPASHAARLFNPKCLYLGYEGRSAMASQFDSCLGMAHGLMAAMLVESGIRLRRMFEIAHQALCGTLPTDIISRKRSKSTLPAILEVDEDETSGEARRVAAGRRVLSQFMNESNILFSSGISGYVTSIRGLCGPPENWVPTAFPITAMLTLGGSDYSASGVGGPADIYAAKGVPLVASCPVSTSLTEKIRRQQSSFQRRQRSPGPLQLCLRSWRDLRLAISLRICHEDYQKTLDDIKVLISDVRDKLQLQTQHGSVPLHTAIVQLRMIRSLVMYFHRGNPAGQGVE